MGLYPASEQFQSGSPSYGSKLATYLRHVLWNSDSATGYSVPCAIGTLHSGYFGALRGSTSKYGQTVKVASFTAASGSAADLCGALYRPYTATECMPVLCFSLKLLTGNYNDSLRYAGVSVRNVSGSTNNTAGSERLHSGNCYAFILATDAAVGGARYLLLRVIGGVPTAIGSSAQFTISAEDAMRPRSLALLVEDSGANVALTPLVEFYDQVGPSGGQGAEAVMGTIIDSSGSKITSAGRCGFYMSREREQTSPTIDTATVAHWFAIKDVNTDAFVLFDEWDRACLDGAALVTGELHGKNGRVLNCMWGGEWGSAVGGLIGQPGGPIDAAQTTSSSQNWVMFSSRPATRDHYTRRKVTVHFIASGTAAADVVLMGRGVSIYDPNSRRAYGFRLAKASGTASFSATLRCYDGANVVPQFRQLALCSVSGLHSAPFSLAYSADIEIELEIENTGGVDASVGIPRLIARINGTAVTGWVLTPGLAGIRIDGDEVFDERPERLLIGREEGIHITTGSGTTNFTLDDWDETQPAGVDLGGESQDTVAVGGEQDGKTGTFGSWSPDPVYDRPRIRRVLPVSQTRFETDHIQRVRLATRERRYFTLPMRAAHRVGEADELRDFVESHKGADTPFDFVDPRTGETIVVQFRDGKHTDTLTGPNSVSVAVEVEECLP